MSAVERVATNVRQQVSAEEWATRVDLAACYRLIAHFGWDDLVFTHISARVPGTHDFLINPYGLMFEEVTASNLVRVDLAGNKTLASPYEINPAGYTIHSALHEAREDAGCVLHLHTTAGIAVSTQRGGLLPSSQQRTLIKMSLAYRDYEVHALNPDEKLLQLAELVHTHVMILRNHGVLAVGRTVYEAFIEMFSL